MSSNFSRPQRAVDPPCSRPPKTEVSGSNLGRASSSKEKQEDGPMSAQKACTCPPNQTQCVNLKGILDPKKKKTPNKIYKRHFETIGEI